MAAIFAYFYIVFNIVKGIKKINQLIKLKVYTNATILANVYFFQQGKYIKKNNIKYY